jgi:hypothetical protein
MNWCFSYNQNLTTDWHIRLGPSSCIVSSTHQGFKKMLSQFSYIYIYICVCRFLFIDIMFDHLYYFNFLCKYYLFCYDLFVIINIIIKTSLF